PTGIYMARYELCVTFNGRKVIIFFSQGYFSTMTIKRAMYLFKKKYMAKKVKSKGVLNRFWMYD
ncbi:MAG: hypothetical protein ACRCXN_00320, partial [Bacteroidales bacterium]